MRREATSHSRVEGFVLRRLRIRERASQAKPSLAFAFAAAVSTGVPVFASASPATPVPTTAPAVTAPSPAASGVVAPAPVASGNAGLAQFDTESGAQKHCPSDKVVWLNLRNDLYFEKDSVWWGKTKRGAYVCRKEADAAGDRDTRNGQ
jgi:hypothetical protein